MRARPAKAAFSTAMLSAVVLPAVLLSVPAFAQEAAQKGMPQLDFANPLTISQVVWLVIVFAVLYALLSSWALPKVGQVLGDRATRIANDLDSAHAAKAEADAALTEAREAGLRSHAEAQAKINAAVDRAKQGAAEQAAALNARLDARLAEAERSIAQARTAAMGSLREVATAAATAMIERLAGRPADPAAIDAAVSTLLPQA